MWTLLAVALGVAVLASRRPVLPFLVFLGAYAMAVDPSLLPGLVSGLWSA